MGQRSFAPQIIFATLPIEGLEALKVRPLDEFGSVSQIVKTFGGKQQYEEAVRELESELYGAA